MKKTIIVAGAAGEGINTVELFIEKILKKSGYEIFSYKNYMSRVRGGYNYSTIVVSDERVFATVEEADIFIALNQEAHNSAQVQLAKGGLLITEEEISDQAKIENVLSFTKEKFPEEIKGKNAFSMAAVGVVLKHFGVEADLFEDVSNKKWKDEVNRENQKAVAWGYEQIKSELVPKVNHQKRMLVGGNQAVALGALSAGLSFYSAYPMAPSTGIMTFLSTYEKEMNIIVEQTEDEIAGIMAAVGASSNGVRAMTGTSGGGFALMVETIGFAAVSETPIVICNVQRPGPATGLPTRTEQADLAFVVTASQGEFSRIVLAPLTVEDAFYVTHRAFNLADKYQVPVIILTDQLLADSTQSIPSFETKDLTIDRYLKTEIEADYKRYDFDNVFGNRKYPGIDAETLVMTDSHVHDPYGHVTEEETATIALKQKFLKRTEAIKAESKAPLFKGVEDYKTLFITWGSTYGALSEAVDALILKGEKVALLAFSDVFPIKKDVLTPYIKSDTMIINVEGNAMNQFGMLLRMETGVMFNQSINKYDGRPFTAKFIELEYEVIKNGQR
ncbi:2-oxoacid:acceptor oxidoreductase subunit alpha [Fusibacter bizertensis]|uniref:2-oxoacid:acceptor oxidoreductase subunit alpha n=1 Tax=Fusibacter bizertensis TaxID=1488331 RepID=A0ABT6NBC4_9FIRM|nr:2-oxoacid:acceptor oxidoreductase subunit alpha [Fusibacter bizertensis]MDH8677718.1 2-oxoacid:acceptor oxidoreductase subunit alpha [Fusibacter bizertensis]